MRLVFAVAVTAAVSAGTLAQSALAKPGVRAGEMANMGTGLCLSSLGTYTQGTIVRQEYCNATYNQSWYAVTQGIGGVEPENYADGWCLTNANDAAANNNPQTMWPCHGNYYKDTYHLSGGGPGGSLHLADDAPSFYPNGYCVTSNGNVSPGSPVVERGCNFSLNQFWSGPIGVLG